MEEYRIIIELKDPTHDLDKVREHLRRSAAQAGTVTSVRIAAAGKTRTQVREDKVIEMLCEVPDEPMAGVEIRRRLNINKAAFSQLMRGMAREGLVEEAPANGPGKWWKLA